MDIARALEALGARDDLLTEQNRNDVVGFILILYVL